MHKSDLKKKVYMALIVLRPTTDITAE